MWCQELARPRLRPGLALRHLRALQRLNSCRGTDWWPGEGPDTEPRDLLHVPPRGSGPARPPPRLAPLRFRGHGLHPTSEALLWRNDPLAGLASPPPGAILLAFLLSGLLCFARCCSPCYSHLKRLQPLLPNEQACGFHSNDAYVAEKAKIIVSRATSNPPVACDIHTNLVISGSFR